MSSDPPPPYSAVAETKIEPTLQPTPAASVSFDPQVGQTQAPSAPSGYETVSYYPASGVAENVPVLLQPQQQPQQQVIVIQSPQVVVVPGGSQATATQLPIVQQPVRQSFVSHICLSCCSLFFCFSCPLSLSAFILACKCHYRAFVITIRSQLQEVIKTN